MLIQSILQYLEMIISLISMTIVVARLQEDLMNNDNVFVVVAYNRTIHSVYKAVVVRIL